MLRDRDIPCDSRDVLNDHLMMICSAITVLEEHHYISSARDILHHLDELKKLGRKKASDYSSAADLAAAARRIDLLRDTIRTELLTELKAESTDQEDNSLYEYFYYLLQLWTIYWPLNNREEKKGVPFQQSLPLCPISYEALTPENRVILSTGFQYDADALNELCLERNNWHDPMTREIFHFRDQAYIQHRVDQVQRWSRLSAEEKQRYAPFGLSEFNEVKAISRSHRTFRILYEVAGFFVTAAIIMIYILNIDFYNDEWHSSLFKIIGIIAVALLVRNIIRWGLDYPIHSQRYLLFSIEAPISPSDSQLTEARPMIDVIKVKLD